VLFFPYLQLLDLVLDTTAANQHLPRDSSFQISNHHVHALCDAISFLNHDTCRIIGSGFF
jgi:hypothetical protein